MELLIALVLVVAVATWVTMPFWRPESASEEGLEDPVLADLEARGKPSNYIRDSELDHAQEAMTTSSPARTPSCAARRSPRILKEIDVIAMRSRRAPGPEAGERSAGCGRHA